MMELVGLFLLNIRDSSYEDPVQAALPFNFINIYKIQNNLNLYLYRKLFCFKGYLVSFDLAPFVYISIPQLVRNRK